MSCAIPAVPRTEKGARLETALFPALKGWVVGNRLFWLRRLYRLGLVFFFFPAVLCVPSSVWQESRAQWSSKGAVTLKIFQQWLGFSTQIKMLIGPLLNMMNQCSVASNLVINSIQGPQMVKKKSLTSLKSRLIDLKINPVIPELGAEDGRGGGWLTVVQHPSLVQEKNMPWTTEEVHQAIKLHHSKTSNVHCGFFFFSL